MSLPLTLPSVLDMYRDAYRRLNDSQISEDVVQEVSTTWWSICYESSLKFFCVL